MEGFYFQINYKKIFQLGIICQALNNDSELSVNFKTNVN